MKCKAFDVVIELEIQNITCPGVWLCPNGKVTIQLYILGLCTQTSALNAQFPISCKEKFSFHKIFSGVQNLYDLDQKLEREIVYMELIQWEDCECGNVLATFKTSLLELLCPCPGRKGVVNGLDVDLLMEATKRFPGIIAPKIEVSTKITIKEVLCALKEDKKKDVIVVNPKLISSRTLPKREVPRRQRKVCHTYKYHRAKVVKKTEKPVFQVCDDIYYPRPQTCGCQKDSRADFDYIRKKVENVKHSARSFDCFSGINDSFCPYCKQCKCCSKKKNGHSSSGIQNSPSRFPQQNKCSCKNAKKNESCTSAEKCNQCCGKPKESSYTVTEKMENGKCGCDCKPKKASETCLCKCHLIDELQEKMRKHISCLSCTSILSNKDDSSNECGTEQFYKSLEKFYKQLYIRAHYKRKNGCCK